MLRAGKEREQAKSSQCDILFQKKKKKRFPSKYIILIFHCHICTQHRNCNYMSTNKLSIGWTVCKIASPTWLIENISNFRSWKLQAAEEIDLSLFWFERQKSSAKSIRIDSVTADKIFLSAWLGLLVVNDRGAKKWAVFDDPLAVFWCPILAYKLWTIALQLQHRIIKSMTLHV